MPQPQDSRTFRVNRGPVGEWKDGDVFTEAMYREKFPAPPAPAGRDPAEHEKDYEDYRAAVFNRLISSGQIAAAPASTAPTQSGDAASAAPDENAPRAEPSYYPPAAPPAASNLPRVPAPPVAPAE